MRRGTLLAACLLAMAAAPARAAVPSEPPDLCLAAADAAARRHGIPPKMMRAITLVETRRSVGGRSGPWPWTLNVAGKGHWLETRAETLAKAERALASGETSVDLGCFQLNYRWHGAAFGGPDEMLDPATGADYAARFLGDLYAETGDWMRAAGLYHSRTPVHANRYRGLVGRALAGLENMPDTPVRRTPAPEVGVPALAVATDPAGRLATGRFALLASGAVAAPWFLALGPAGRPRAGKAAHPGAVVLRLAEGAPRPMFASASARP